MVPCSVLSDGILPGMDSDGAREGGSGVVCFDGSGGCMILDSAVCFSSTGSSRTCWRLLLEQFTQIILRFRFSCFGGGLGVGVCSRRLGGELVV